MEGGDGGGNKFIDNITHFDINILNRYRNIITKHSLQLSAKYHVLLLKSVYALNKINLDPTHVAI